MNEIIRKVVLYDMPGTADVVVQRDVPFEGGVMDVYSAPDAAPNLPVVIIVAGFPDAGFAKHAGSRFKDMGSSVSWARLMAASGMVAVTYANREPERDLHALLRHFAGRDIAVWASSGNGPLAVSVLMHDAPVRLRCAVLCYPYTLDVPAEARAFGFVTPADGRTVDDLAPGIPLLIVRAGGDQVPRLNDTLDRFVAAAIARDLPVTLVNHPGAPHAFDLVEDSEGTRAIVRLVLAFLQAR
jgi:hypothetical protein